MAPEIDATSDTARQHPPTLEEDSVSFFGRLQKRLIIGSFNNGSDPISSSARPLRRGSGGHEEGGRGRCVVGPLGPI